MDAVIMGVEIMKKILLTVISFLLVSCGRGIVFTEFAQLPSTGWEQDSLLRFEPVIEDTSGNYDVLLVVRHTDRYAYQNLWLFVDVLRDSTLIRRDTINGMLADQDGAWYGRGMYIMEWPMLYLVDEELEAGSYQLVLQQAMREPTLRGITDVGVKVVKNQE